MVKKVVKMISITIMLIGIFNIFELHCTNSRVLAIGRNPPTMVTVPGDTGGGVTTEPPDIVGGGTLGTGGLNDISDNVDYWKPLSIDDNDRKEVQTMAGKIVGIIRVIGIFISVGTLSVIGVKYMLGSVEEKAQYKQTLIPWLIGAILLFAMTTVPAFIYDIIHSIFAGEI